MIAFTRVDPVVGVKPCRTRTNVTRTGGGESSFDAIGDPHAYTPRLDRVASTTGRRFPARSPAPFALRTKRKTPRRGVRGLSIFLLGENAGEGLADIMRVKHKRVQEVPAQFLALAHSQKLATEIATENAIDFPPLSSDGPQIRGLWATARDGKTTERR